ncbi:helix-turn-helix transcriptional regulator [uncultured Phenylobacterium sp.]|uniref:helix-turn-helix domain-containing protein n=1 Tax=uncultured Phenylobacterium sp. TaxID=349273 RepID=UPI0025CCD073|nr:helix-turn-helix transcriptional regulator [uncultured Phenylobacterium sp.]
MSEEIDLHLGQRLRRRRRLLGMTQQELGALCGVRFQQIQKYETAANRMSAGMIGRLARALDVQVGYFFEGLELPLVAQSPRPDRRARKSGISEEGGAAQVQTGL